MAIDNAILAEPYIK